MTDSLQQLVGQVSATIAPADWNPPYNGHLPMRISRDGHWHYQGTRMEREELIRLFAGILRLEKGVYCLVTPVEKYSIDVDELPFVSRELEILNPGPHQQVVLTSNVGDRLVLGTEHPLGFHLASNGESLPSVEVRNGLCMLVQRSHYYQLADIALEQADNEQERPGIRSDGITFALSVEHP